VLKNISAAFTAVAAACRPTSMAMPVQKPMLAEGEGEPNGKEDQERGNHEIETGKAAGRPHQTATGAVPSAISDLVAYLRRDDAKWLEQEELDPKLPPSREY
jgi:hypothetical protein